MSAINRTPLALVLATLVALPLGAAAPARAGSERYVAITALPATVSTPGCYRLVGNLTLTSANNAITINCDNVVIDLDGFTIVSAVPAGGQSVGVAASGRSNVTVRNGTLRGFGVGVSLSQTGTAPNGPSGLVVEDLKVIESELQGISLQYVGGAIVRRCDVVGTISQASAPIGIRVSGWNACVLDNVIHRTYGPPSSGTATAIDVSGCVYAVVARNVIANPSPLDNLYSVGINASGQQVMVTENRIAHMERGISYNLRSPLGAGLYSDNFVVDCWTPYAGGTDAGGNH
jgi:hypothetical protein